MQPSLLPDFLPVQGHTLLHHIGMHHDPRKVYSQQDAISQIIQQLTHSGADINAKDIRVCPICNPKNTVTGRDCCLPHYHIGYMTSHVIRCAIICLY